MEPIEILHKKNILDWMTLLLGLQKGWVNNFDISNYAIEILSGDIDGLDENIAMLAEARKMHKIDIQELILEISSLNIANVNPNIKWRYALLLSLDQSNISEKAKINKLQELYADFEYPEDMESCSIYSQDNLDPLSSMRLLINDLERKIELDKSIV